MTEQLEDLINYRLQRAFDTYEEAIVLADNNHWNACINRFYYSCFYAINALLIKNNFSSSKHSGVRSLFNKEYVQKGVVSKEYSKIYNDLFKLRQESDYEDFYKEDTNYLEMQVNVTLGFPR